jgi:putative nucleotidyltransferase with HDIG domain
MSATTTRGAAGPARWLLYPTRHIRWKIIAPYVILTILLAAAGTYLTMRLVLSSLSERFDNQLAEAARVASDAVVRREREHLEAVRAVSFTDGVAPATESWDAWALARLAQPIAANAGTERLEVLDVNGHRVFGIQLADSATRSYGSIVDADDRATWPIVQDVLAKRSDALGDKFAQIVDTPAGPALYSAGPIYEGDRLAGVVLAGSLLESFLPVAKGDALADVTIYDAGGAPLASTFATSPDADLRPAEDISGAGQGALRERKVLFGRDFDLLYGELRVREQPVGMYSVALPSSFIVSAGAETAWQLGALFAVGTCAVLLTGWFLGESLTRPLLRLVDAARTVSAGDLTVRAGVRSGDEIGVLGEAFDAMTERLQRQHLATIRALTSAIDARDPYTLGHSVRVGQLAAELGRRIGLPPGAIQHLEVGGYLHDIGKIGVRDAVLLKPGALTQAERDLVERHPDIGLEILAPVELAPEVIEIVARHHEKLNGSGYPRHADGRELSILARIACVADMYDALTTDRPYRRGMTPEEAMKVLRSEAFAGQIDPDVVSVLQQALPEWEERRASDRSLGGFRPAKTQQEAA